MMKLRGHEFDFDISCPEDLERYLRCSEEMTQKAASAPPMPADIYPKAEISTAFVSSFIKTADRSFPIRLFSPP